MVCRVRHTLFNIRTKCDGYLFWRVTWANHKRRILGIKVGNEFVEVEGSYGLFGNLIRVAEGTIWDRKL